mmetsp:Transcript_6065/g.15630  ORF Transcript_6065/g.15630 Transcript_6065/m.15630 type:complete len:235 (+) Transcript_6065:91-795(+)
MLTRVGAPFGQYEYQAPTICSALSEVSKGSWQDSSSCLPSTAARSSSGRVSAAHSAKPTSACCTPGEASFARRSAEKTTTSGVPADSYGAAAAACPARAARRVVRARTAAACRPLSASSRRASSAASHSGWCLTIDTTAKCASAASVRVASWPAVDPGQGSACRLAGSSSSSCRVCTAPRRTATEYSILLNSSSRLRTPGIQAPRAASPPRQRTSAQRTAQRKLPAAAFLAAGA